MASSAQSTMLSMNRNILSVAFLLLLLSNLIVCTSSASHPFKHVILVDAGSGGSRAYVYEITEKGNAVSISASPGKGITPGLATFGKNPDMAIEYIQPLVEFAKSTIPTQFHRETPFFLMGTAGMRLLTDGEQEQIYDTIYESFVADTSFSFRIHRRNFETITGSEEAYYAVLSTNYLENRIDSNLHLINSNSGMLGALDMGGASTQIVFAPGRSGSLKRGDLQRHEHTLKENVTHSFPASYERNDDQFTLNTVPDPGRLKIDENDFWSVSHLSYGVAEIRTRVWNHIVSRSSKKSDGNRIANPCTFPGYVESHGSYILEGTGHMSKCTDIIREVIWGENVDKCPKFGACPIDGVQMPPIRGDFYAMSIYYYTLDCVRHIGPVDLEHWPRPTLAELEHAVEHFCSMRWSDDMKPHRFTSIDRLPHRCIESSYLTTLLRYGYGFPRHSRNITIALEVNGMEVEWTLGYLLSEVLNGHVADLVAPALDHITNDIHQVMETLEHPTAHFAQYIQSILHSYGCSWSIPDIEKVVYSSLSIILYMVLAWYLASVVRAMRAKGGSKQEV